MWKKIKERVICMEIYLVSACNYDHELIIGYFTDEQKAREYCKLHNSDNEYYNDMKYCVRKVKELN
jgi:hypothetical protein